MSSQIYKGSCKCGNIALTIELPPGEEIGEARECDCEFCVSYVASYVSNPRGNVCFEITDENKVEKSRQGTNTAFFLVCSACKVLVSANYEENKNMYSSVNVGCIQNIKPSGTNLVSPRLLDKEQKVSRWKELWFKSSVTTNSL